MPSWFRPAEKANSLIALVERAVEYWPHIIFILVSGGGMSWFATITDWLDKFGPIAWGLSGLFGVLIATIIIMIWARFRLLIEKRKYLEISGDIQRAVNPLNTIFENVRFNISDFHNPFHEPVENKTFVNCEIIGPGVVFFGGGHIEPSTFKSCDFLVITSNNIYNGVSFNSCSFKNCKFYNLTIFVPEDHFDAFNIKGANWRTRTPI